MAGKKSDKSARRRPYMPFYCERYESDFRVLGMDPAEEGVYFRLLRWSWMSDDPGYIPKDDEIIAKRCARITVEEWKQTFKQTILSCYEDAGERGYLQKCQRKIYEEMCRISNARSRAGRSGGKASGRSRGRSKREANVQANDQARGEQKSTPQTPNSITTTPIGVVVPSAPGEAIASRPTTPQAELYEFAVAGITKRCGPYDRLDETAATFKVIYDVARRLGKSIAPNARAPDQARAAVPELKGRLARAFKSTPAEFDILGLLDETGWTVKKLFAAEVIQGLSETNRRKPRKRHARHDDNPARIRNDEAKADYDALG